MTGRLRSALIIGGQGIRARKLRTLLSILSLFLGVLAVITVQAALELANRALLTDVELSRGKDGTVVLYVQPDQRAIPIIVDTLRGTPDAIAEIETQAIIGEPGVSPLNPGASPFDRSDGFYPGPGAESGPGLETGPRGDDRRPPPGQAVEVRIAGLTGDIRRFRPFEPDSGQWLDFAGEPRLAPRLVLNREAAKGFARFQIPAEMHIDGARANPTPHIGGVVHDGGYGPYAYVRADELLNWLPADAVGRQGGVQIMMDPKATGLEQTLKARLKAVGVGEDRLYRTTIRTTEHYTDQLSLLRWIFFGMAILVLLIGVAGILNVGLASVGERVEEFALRRAVGTPRLLLAGIILAETLFIGVLTAVAAIGVGIVGLKLSGHVLGDYRPFLRNVTFPWQAGLAGGIAGLAAGVLGGLIPAVRAAKIPIATVMRA